MVKTLFAKESNKASPCADKPKRPDSGHPLPVQSNSSVKNLDALIPARVQQVSRATKRPALDALLLWTVRVLWPVSERPESGRLRCSGRVGGVQSLDTFA